MTTDATLTIEDAAPTVIKPRQKRATKKSIANDPVQGVAWALEIIDKLQEQNQKASDSLDTLGTVWLNAAAARRRAEATIALNHFDGALGTLRKALDAQAT